jgi:nitroimidazol reductase NimA-like FMN-containing flavoprotein (pyridoxamine 5'-phosphate oxidase superfamily)
MSDNRHRRLVELDRAECLDLLGSVSFGRIVFTYKALPAIRPVNHILRRGEVIIRSHLGSAMVSAAADGAVVAYEADDIDPVEHVGWSVVVTGHARLITDPELIARYYDQLEPWTDDFSMDYVLYIESELVTGFELIRETAAGYARAGESVDSGL